MSAVVTEIGFLGLGAMGLGMASRLLDKGFSVAVWNRSPEPTERLSTRPGATVAASPAEVFSTRTVVHSMLANEAALFQVVNDESLSDVPSGHVHVNHSTISPQASRELADRHARHGVGYVHAPVLGRSTVVETGQLLVVCSGNASAVSVAEHSLAALGQRVWNLGTDATFASVVKIAVNYNITIALQSIAESVSLVEAAGIEPLDFVEILTHTAFSGSAHRGYAPLIAEQNYEPVGFSMQHGLKDLGLAESTAAGLGVALRLAPVLRDVFEVAMSDPALSGVDWSAVAEVTRRRAQP